MASSWGQEGTSQPSQPGKRAAQAAVAEKRSISGQVGMVYMERSCCSQHPECNRRRMLALVLSGTFG